MLHEMSLFASAREAIHLHHLRKPAIDHFQKLISLSGKASDFKRENAPLKETNMLGHLLGHLPACSFAV